MQLTKFTDYSLRTLLYLGLKSRQATVAEIAKNFNISRHHLVKAVHFLAQNDYVSTTKGAGGGITLKIAPDKIRLGDFILKTENNLKLLECFDAKTNTCPIIGICGLQNVINKSLNKFIEELNKYTLLDCLNSPGRAERIAKLKLDSR